MLKKQFVVAVFAALALTSCSPKVDTRGYVTDKNLVEEIKPGLTREDVLSRFGSPSSQSTFGNEAWYYISGRQETVAFFSAETVKQNVVRVQFGADGKVEKVEDYTEKDGQDIALVKRTTPTEGHTLGFVEQALGNIGRFNTPAGANNSAAPGRRPSSY